MPLSPRHRLLLICLVVIAIAIAGLTQSTRFLRGSLGEDTTLRQRVLVLADADGNRVLSSKEIRNILKNSIDPASDISAYDLNNDGALDRGDVRILIRILRSFSSNRPLPAFLHVEYYAWKRISNPENVRAPLQNVDVLIFFSEPSVSIDPDENGRFHFSDDMLAQLAALKRVINPDTQLWLGFRQLDAIVGNDAAIDEFIAEVRTAAAQYGFEGVDFDWEGEQSLEDYTDVIQRLSAALKTDTFGFTTGIGIASQYVDKAAAVKDKVDWFNVQFYYSTENSMSMDEMNSKLQEFTDAGVPKSKISGGLPLFGMVNMEDPGKKPATRWVMSFNGVSSGGEDDDMKLPTGPSIPSDFLASVIGQDNVTVTKTIEPGGLYYNLNVTFKNEQGGMDQPMIAAVKSPEDSFVPITVNEVTKGGQGVNEVQQIRFKNEPITTTYMQMLNGGADPLLNTWTNPQTNLEYHYSGTPLVAAKTQLLWHEGYRGVFTWEMSMDAPYDSANSILKTIDETVSN